MENKILEAKITLQADGKYLPTVLKSFAPENGGGSQVFSGFRSAGMHAALENLNGMVTMSPAQRDLNAPLSPLAVTIDQDARDALATALDLAHGDQKQYMGYGDPKSDFGSEWPEVAHRKANQFRALGKFADQVFPGEADRWNRLADEILETLDDEEERARQAAEAKGDAEREDA